MKEFLLVVHVLICAAMIGFILLQKSEGGALGIGGGGGFMTGRGQANLLTRVTAFLALAFFITSISLTIMGQRTGGGSLLDRLQTNPATNSSSPAAPATGTGSSTAPATAPATGGATPAPAAPAGGGGGLLDRLQQGGSNPQ